MPPPRELTQAGLAMTSYGKGTDITVAVQDFGGFFGARSESTMIPDNASALSISPQTILEELQGGSYPNSGGQWVFDKARNVSFKASLENSNSESKGGIASLDPGLVLRRQVRKTPYSVWGVPSQGRRH